MISSLNGKLIFKDNSHAIIECGGVGFSAFITANTSAVLPSVGENARLFTYLSVREDALDLYGFSSGDELEVFKLITSVSGVGPKIGLAILTSITPDRVLLAIAGGDAKALTAASGVGIKLAQRVILELKDKIGGLSVAGGGSDSYAGTAVSSASSNINDAIQALVALGYSQSDSYSAVSRLDSGLSTDELIKNALKNLLKGF